MPFFSSRFSYADKEDTKDETMVGNDVYYFLQGFYQMHSKYRNNPVFVVGESYGGHYAPAVAHRIMMGNKDLKDDCLHVNLKGLAVGNGVSFIYLIFVFTYVFVDDRS